MTRYTLPPDTTFDNFIEAMRPPQTLLTSNRIQRTTPNEREWQIRWLAFIADAEAQDTHEELREGTES